MYLRVPAVPDSSIPNVEPADPEIVPPDPAANLIANSSANPPAKIPADTLNTNLKHSSTTQIAASDGPVLESSESFDHENDIDLTIDIITKRKHDGASFFSCGGESSQQHTNTRTIRKHYESFVRAIY